MYLTKSDFKLANPCPTKLFYRKNGESAPAADEYTRLLAEGGFMVEEIARQLHPGGRFVGFQGTPEQAAERTLAELAAGDCVLFEATLLSGRLLARVDVLVKRGDEIELIEVKAGSFPGAEHRARLAAGEPGVFRGKKKPFAIGADWREYLDDIAFQVSAARQALPGMRITPFLMMPDTSVTTPVEGMWRLFSVDAGNGARPVVRFTGDPAVLRDHPMLAKVEVAAEVQDVLESVENRAKVYVGSIFPTLTRLHTPPSLHCGDCDLHGATDDGERRLFHG